MLLEVDLSKRPARVVRADHARWEANPVGTRVTPVGDNATDGSLVEVLHDRVVLRRGFSGEHPLFYAVRGQTAWASDRVHDIAALFPSKVDLLAAYSYVYFEYAGRERTLFEGIREVLNGQTLTLQVGPGQAETGVTVDDGFALPMEEDASDDVEALVAQLRAHIATAHERRAKARNGVLLSGGVDSQVMAVSLVRDLGRKDTFAAHFSVVGAAQNEIEPARRVAHQLGMEWVPVAVDPAAEIDWDAVLRANNPYIGSLSMSAVMDKVVGGAPVTLFAGQDTRLHTPALGRVDALLWNTVFRMGVAARGGVAVARALQGMLQLRIDSLPARALELAAHSATFAEFVANRCFHVRRTPFNRDSAIFQRIYSEIVLELREIRPNDKRRAYNSIVAANWRRQYLFDIGYMVQACEDGNARCAMPFYDRDLSAFAARLPFKLATRFTTGRAGHGSKVVRVNKYLLRRAYDKDLERDLIFRDKAVCKTNYMFFNGSLRPLIDEFCRDEDVAQLPEGRALHFPELQQLCRTKRGAWRQDDSWLTNMVFNAMVVRSMLRAQ